MAFPSFQPNLGNQPRPDTLVIQLRQSGQLQNKAVHQRCVERQVLPRADSWHLPDRHRRTTEIGG